MKRVVVITASIEDGRSVHDSATHAGEAVAALEANGFSVDHIVVVPLEAGEAVYEDSFPHMVVADA